MRTNSCRPARPQADATVADTLELAASGGGCAVSKSGTPGSLPLPQPPPAAANSTTSFPRKKLVAKAAVMASATKSAERHKSDGSGKGDVNGGANIGAAAGSGLAGPGRGSTIWTVPHANLRTGRDSSTQTAPAPAPASTACDDTGAYNTWCVDVSFEDMQGHRVATRSVSIFAQRGDTVADLKKQFEEKEGFPSSEQKWHYAGREPLLLSTPQNWLFAGRELDDDEVLGPRQSDEDPDLPWALGESGCTHAVLRMVAPVSWNTASAQSAPDVSASAQSAALIPRLENFARHTVAAPEISRGPSAQSSTGPMATESPDGSVVDLRHVADSPARNDKRPPVICKHSMFSHGLDGAPFQQRFESLMDLVNTSLSTVFPRHMATEARIRVLERMIECLSKRVPRIDVLQSLVHRNGMHSDVIDWFLLSFCQACGIPCACENQQFLEPACVEHDSCPFTIKRVPPNLVVWGVSLFEKLRMCNDKDDIREFLRGKWIGRHFEGREHVAFVDGWKGHYTPGLFHMCANSPAVSWWCSMQWQAKAINKLSALALVNAVTGKDPTFHEVEVPKQRKNECAPRSLLQVVLNVLQIAQGHDPRCLVLPPRSFVNDDSDAFRFCLALNYIKSLGSAGHFDYTDAFRKATTDEPACAISLVCESSDSDEQDPPAEVSAGGDPSRPSGDIIGKPLRYTPNTTKGISPGLKLTVQPSHIRSVPHGTIEGAIYFDAGGRRHHINFKRHAYTTSAKDACGFIFLTANIMDAVADAVFMGHLKQCCVDVAERFQAIAELSRDDRADCAKFREYICRAMLEFPKEICSSFWSSDPNGDMLRLGLRKARNLGIVNDKITDCVRTRGELWAIAVLNPRVQLDEGYLRVFMRHLDEQVGFLVIQRRNLMRGDSGAQPTGDRQYSFTHSHLNDLVPNNPTLMWPLLHNVFNANEPAGMNFFEVLRAAPEPDQSSSIFFVNQMMNDQQQNQRTAAVFVGNEDTSTPAGGGSLGPSADSSPAGPSRVSGLFRQSSIGDVFCAKEGKVNSGCEQQLERGQGTSEQSQFDSIVDSLQNGRPSATGIAARDHNSRNISVVAGEEYIAAKDLDHLPLQVRAALRVMRIQCGFDLHRVCGQGSYGVVVEVSHRDERFAVKLGTCAYSDQSSRRSVLVEAALLSFGENFQRDARKSGADAIGPFAPRLRPWYGCPAVLINTEGQRFAAVAMELADFSARKIFDTLGNRFRADNYSDPQEDLCLLRDLRSLLTGCLKVVHYMHRAGLAHCDLKPCNMLMKKLDATPPHDSLLAWCMVQDQVYQILVCDFGHTRWSGRGEKAAHVFCDDGKLHSNNSIDDDVATEPNSVGGVGLRELQVLFGLGLKNSQEFRRPGPPTEWIRCPDFDRSFEKGQGNDQRKWDQAADIWALGAMCARLVAAPKFSSRKMEEDMRQWQAHLFEFSSRADASVQSALESDRKRQRVAGNPFSFGSKRAVKASTAAVALAQSCRPPHRRELWLEVMVRENYDADPGAFLGRRIKGAQGESWRSLLDFVQNLLSYSSDLRRNFAAGALRHPFFVSPDPNAV
jgi:serine/threonine protein kinase